ncbi:MAG: aldo/keto reductase [Acidobacteria bacterium]|nr:aldo/keto reductase [Acidobacteriota bacterium]
MIPQAAFGRTGHLSTRVIFGAAALSGMSADRSAATLQLIADHGVNHIDVAAGYGNGRAEMNLAPWLVTNRSSVFLATKTGERSGDAARRELELSLTRLGVDSVDLIQLHNLVEPDEWEIAHAKGGAADAMFAARDEGLVRFVGVTGHGRRIPGVHLRSLATRDYDSVLFPYNHTMLGWHDYRRDVEALLSLCAERDVAVQTIKSIARGRWGDGDVKKFSWYEPITDPAAIARAVRFVLSRDRLFLNSTSDARLLPLVLEAAAGGLSAPGDDELSADESTFGISALFDGADLERI